MAHPSRSHLYEPLSEKLGIGITLDSRDDRWDTGRKSLLAYDSEATHHLVIQDDAVPAADLLLGIEAWLPHLPKSILCLYSGRLQTWRRIHARHAKPPCFLQMNDIQWGVALVVPTDCIDVLVKNGDRLTRVGNYDMRLGLANRATYKLPVLYPSPSWVDHAHTPSLVPGRSPSRHALNALTAEQSVLDWAVPGDAPIIKCPDFNRRPAGQQFYRTGRGI